MRTREDIEAYLLRSELPHEEVDEAMWLVHDPASRERIVIRLIDEMVLFRLKVMELDRVREREKLFEHLLELNASEMVHGAYGIADGSVVLTCVLRLQSLDYGEFQGTIDDFSLALTNHYEALARFRDAA
jgi:hypothetical protein